ncbi:nicotinate phosphoribosyltransferase [Frankia sp. AgB1.9]|uniref:nicotinate phosphoribosyltransferase n=1 Tax=unclassified Frankia TaxID=2632575 RepID=UPI001934672F|nr:MULTISPECIES: nicotinate phosphoribosyltransferase [unclassified Frankia]MBL7490208.1 nicotinate phosphoribosyltransferase [Frankia sp. AgW1.1]MBL7547098.1 nicotinate phosphoribosyltransferase [Frankia sp. AgB1.9]MBL7619388.1 nicotinate phosphoribosyltransferase [Frankia sp. AgB1.8]
MSTALLTDHYELTMLRAALKSGAAHRRATFEVFARSLPAGRRYGVVAGTGRLLAALADFRFGPEELSLLTGSGVVDAATADWLAAYRFSGDIRGFAEGEPFLPGTPVLVVEGPFAECVLLETLTLSVLNHDSAVAAAGARMVQAAGSRPLIEMGSRRTHEEAAVAAARAAYLVGFAATSNLEAARRWGVPSNGTAAHAFTLAHPTEREAFEAQVDTLGVDTTLLVDTYDTEAGIAAAVAAAGPGLGAIRIDSGDPAAGVRAARAQLDALGATETRIIVTGDLDEHSIARLAGVPAAGYGVGTSLVTGSGAPTAGFVYKLVEIDGRPVAKTSVGKSTRGGRKDVLRRHDAGGVAVVDLVLPAGERPGGGDAAARGQSQTADGLAPSSLDGPAEQAPPVAGSLAGPGRDRPLLVELVRDGAIIDPTVTGPVGLRRARDHHRAAIADLPRRARDVAFGHPCLPVITSVPHP